MILGGLVGSFSLATSKVLAVVSDVIPDELSFQFYFEVDDVSPCQTITEDQVTGITEPIVLRVDVTGFVGTPPSIEIRVASTPNSSDCPPGTGSIGIANGFYTFTNGTTFSVNNNDYIAISGTSNSGFPGGDSVSFDIVNTSDGDVILASITIQTASFCFLTTAVVNYMGLLDNGPELTAMRLLREHYRDVPGYAEIIQEYYTNSQAIIDAFNASADADFEYNYIYNTVIAVMNHVNAEEWQQGHDLYLAMYNDLKSRYLA